MALLLRNPVSVMLMVAGPLLWLLGLVAGSAVIGRLGQTMAWLVLLIPAFAVLVGSYAAYRPGASRIYGPVRWTFDEDSIDIEQPERRARAEWREFSGWRSAAGCYLLHTDPRHYVLVPMRDVPEADRAVLESLLVSKLGPHRR
jgi:hypothetical protein